MVSLPHTHDVAPLDSPYIMISYLAFVIEGETIITTQKNKISHTITKTQLVITNKILTLLSSLSIINDTFVEKTLFLLDALSFIESVKIGKNIIFSQIISFTELTLRGIPKLLKSKFNFIKKVNNKFNSINKVTSPFNLTAKINSTFNSVNKVTGTFNFSNKIKGKFST